MAGGTITGVIVVGVGVTVVVFCILRRKPCGIKKPGHAHNTTPTNQLTGGPSVSRMTENKSNLALTFYFVYHHLNMSVSSCKKVKILLSSDYRRLLD